MKFALSVLVVIASLVLNAQTLQGKVVRVFDGDMIVILAEAKAKKIGLWRDANPIPPWEFRKTSITSMRTCARRREPYMANDH